MRNFVHLIVGGCLVAGLGGCGHVLTLQPLDGGQPGHGDTVLRGSPTMVRLDGKLYRGVLRSDGTTEPSPTRRAGPVQVGRYYGQRSAGGGRIIDFTAKDGATVVCRLSDQDRRSYAASGLCESDQGRTFSLVIE